MYKASTVPDCVIKKVIQYSKYITTNSIIFRESGNISSLSIQAIMNTFEQGLQNTFSFLWIVPLEKYIAN